MIEPRGFTGYIETNVAGAEPDAKKQLIELIRVRTTHIVNDCRTYLRVRTEKYDWMHSDHGDRPLGGGNFLMALGLSALLNFLAKAHLHLTEPESFVSEADREAVREAIKFARTLPELKAILKDNHTAWKLPRVGECNEERAFAKFVAATRDCINLGIETSEQASQVWKEIRNHLTHMAYPNGGVGAYKERVDSLTMEGKIRLGPPAFVKYPNGWACLVDRLYLDMPSVAEWLCQQIEAYDDARVDDVLKWVNAEN